MECQKIVEALSSFIDGEVDNYDASVIEMHLEHCSACREQWQLLLGVTSLLQSMPEEIPHPKFHSDLMSKLTKTKLFPVAMQGVVLPDLNTEQDNNMREYRRSQLSENIKVTQFTEQEEENNYKDNSKKFRLRSTARRNFIGSPWLKLSAYAAVLAMVFGISALLYPGELGLKKEYGSQLQIMSDSKQVATNSSKSTDNIVSKEQTDETIKDLSTAKEKAAKVPSTLAQNSSELQLESSAESTDKDVTENKNAESNKRTLSTDVIAGQNEASAPALPSSNEDKTPYDVFSLKSPDGGVSEAVPQMLSAKQLRNKVMQMNVENSVNTTAQILILSENINATAKVENNKISITVPAENYEELVNQIENLSLPSTLKAMDADTAQASENKSLVVQIEEQ